MSNEVEYALNKFENALKKLKDGARAANDELTRDGVVQRFEFTFEVFWKALKVFLENKGVIAKTPKDVLKEAFRLDLLGDDEELFIDMLKDRNLTSHVYDENTVKNIFQHITDKYINALESVLKKLLV